MRKATTEEAGAELERLAKKHEIKSLAAGDPLTAQEEKRKASKARKAKKILDGKTQRGRETATLETEEKGEIENAESHNCRD
jgi:RNase H-fold protein (predicted Holliday junction resolvase)